jgi:hypothetical protein
MFQMSLMPDVLLTRLQIHELVQKGLRMNLLCRQIIVFSQTVYRSHLLVRLFVYEID